MIFQIYQDLCEKWKFLLENIKYEPNVEIWR